MNHEKIVRCPTEFYLCSHNCDKGTIRSTHYCFLQNKSGLAMSDLLQFTYNLCCLFAKGTKLISIPLPVKYAHQAAYRARSHLSLFDQKQTGPQANSDSSTADSAILPAIRPTANQSASVDRSVSSRPPISPSAVRIHATSTTSASVRRSSTVRPGRTTSTSTGISINASQEAKKEEGKGQGQERIPELKCFRLIPTNSKQPQTLINTHMPTLAFSSELLNELLIEFRTIIAILNKKKSF